MDYLGYCEECGRGIGWHEPFLATGDDGDGPCYCEECSQGMDGWRAVAEDSSVYYSIVSSADGWDVRFGGRTLATFRTHAEAAAFIEGRRSLEATLTGHGARRAAAEGKAKQSADQTG